MHFGWSDIVHYKLFMQLVKSYTIMTLLSNFLVQVLEVTPLMDMCSTTSHWMETTQMQWWLVSNVKLLVVALLWYEEYYIGRPNSLYTNYKCDSFHCISTCFLGKPKMSCVVYYCGLHKKFLGICLWSLPIVVINGWNIGHDKNIIKV